MKEEKLNSLGLVGLVKILPINPKSVPRLTLTVRQPEKGSYVTWGHFNESAVRLCEIEDHIYYSFTQDKEGVLYLLLSFAKTEERRKITVIQPLNKAKHAKFKYCSLFQMVGGNYRLEKIGADQEEMYYKLVAKTGK